MDLSMRDTIAALATAPGQAGIAIVRISGNRAKEVLQKVFVPNQANCPFEPNKLYLGKAIKNGVQFEECMAVLMKAPRSYTRQDVAEIHLHGGSYAANTALDVIFSFGVRPAAPGEFTLRAFLNGRVDLSSAEAVMKLISSCGERANSAAIRQLNGGTSAFIRDAQKQLVTMLASLEAALDYPEEIEEQQTQKELAHDALSLEKMLRVACDERSARLMEEGLQVALIGLPNAGKSTLLNALMMEERAIVTDIPGTTRDIVRGTIQLGGLAVHLSDTAGIREGGDMVEQIGVSRALDAARNADVALVLCDARTPDDRDTRKLWDMLSGQKLLVYTKADLCAGNHSTVEDAILISAKTGLGMAALREKLADFARGVGESPLTDRRHIALARTAADALHQAADTFLSGAPLEFGAVSLHEALDALAGVTGERVDEQLLDDIFSRFCVGK